MSVVSYRELRKLSAVTARQKVLELHQSHRPSHIARLLAMSRATVYNILARYRRHGLDGLADHSRRPLQPAGQTAVATERIVVLERARTGFGPRRMRRHLQTNAALTLPESTLRNIFRRNGQTKKRKRRKQARAINLEPLYPLQRFPIDLKYILDFDALPASVYNHAVRRGLPPYQWTAIDVKTRLRFLAYSYEKSAANGLLFMQTVALWLRSFGVHLPLEFQTDWGEEFGGKSPRKLAQLQRELFEPLGVLRSHIRKGHSEDNAYVERSHRTDDEEFYIPWLGRCLHTENFLYRAFHSLYTYNTARPHQGRGMDQMTPWEKLHSLLPELQPGLAAFPPLLLDDLSAHNPLPNSTFQTVQHLPAPYLVSSFTRLIPSRAKYLDQPRCCWRTRHLTSSKLAC
jgi:transposase InsO family protein